METDTTRDRDDELEHYFERTEPLPPNAPIGPPDVQPGEAPIERDE